MLSPATTPRAGRAPEEGPKGPAPAPYRRRRVPTVLQMEAVECGAASLAMILARFGRYVPLEELRVACGVSRDGSKASNLVRAAARYGLKARGFRCEPAALRTQPLPAILHWNFNHFVVLEGFGRRYAYLNDPAAGPRKVSYGELDKAFTGVAITFTTTPEFVPGGQRPSMLAALGRRIRGSHSAVLYAFLASLGLVIPGLLAPTFTRILVDDVLVRGFVYWLKPLLLIMAGTCAVVGALTWLQQSHLLRLETKVAVGTSSRFFWHVLRLPIAFFNQRYAGEIAGRVAINDRVARLLSEDLATAMLNLVVIAFYAILMSQYDAVLTVIGVTVAGLNIAVLKYASRQRADLSQRALQDQGRLVGVAMGGLQTIETLKATGSESDFFARWAGHQARLVNAQQELGLKTQLLGIVPPLLLSASTALVLGVGAFRVMDGHLSMGMLIAFQALMLSFLMPVNKLVDLGGTLQDVKGDMNRLDDVLRADADPAVLTLAGESRAESAPVKLAGELELRNVSFGYSPLDAPLIQDFSIRLEPGRRVALVGGSGCGKTTIARLVCGLYTPWSGEILFDGVPRSQVDRVLLNNSFAVVDQEIFLFEGTVRENLSLWDPTVPEHDIIRAARDACIHEEIAARPGGYGSRVEEGGRNFSGGQRQRLEIARALVRNPTILVLDEATSALDPTTEKAIDDNLRRRGCTCLIVAHRLSTIRDCDEIILLDAGRIVDRGTHEQLLHTSAAYRDLIAAE